MDADELVRRYVLRHYRDHWYYHRPAMDPGPVPHLVGCPEVVVDAQGEDGTYGCDTGCEYVRFTATITCPHGERVEHEFGEFGELAWILDDMARDEPERAT